MMMKDEWCQAMLHEGCQRARTRYAIANWFDGCNTQGLKALRDRRGTEEQKQTRIHAILRVVPVTPFQASTILTAQMSRADYQQWLCTGAALQHSPWKSAFLMNDWWWLIYMLPCCAVHRHYAWAQRTVTVKLLNLSFPLGKAFQCSTHTHTNEECLPQSDLDTSDQVREGMFSIAICILGEPRRRCNALSVISFLTEKFSRSLGCWARATLAKCSMWGIG